MGEAGPEAIMPLASVNGRLGVMAVRESDEELIAEVRALREEVAALKAQNAAWAERDIENSDRVVSSSERSRRKVVLERAR
jgi:phage-related minor tail protein